MIMKRSAILTLSLTIVCGCTDQEKIKQIEEQIEQVKKDILTARDNTAIYTEGSALWGLSTLRLNIYNQTLAMLEQKKYAEWYYPVFKYTVDGKNYLPPENREEKIKKLESELNSAKHEEEVSKAKVDVAGGLMAAIVALEAETKSLTVAQLNYQLTALRNDFPPFIGGSENYSDKESKSNTDKTTHNSNTTPTQASLDQDNKTTDNTPKDFRNTRWGMPKDEVKKSESIPVKYEDSKLLVYQSTVASMGAKIIYIFSNNKLVRAKYVITEEHTNKNQYISDFNNLKEILTKKYEKPKDERITWLNDLYKDDYSKWGMAISSGDLTYFSEWEKDDTNIFLLLSGDNYKIQLGVEYTSKSLEELEEKENNQKRASEL
jgi:hypothetical protein